MDKDKFSNRQIYEKNEEMIKNQDEKLDQILDKIQITKQINKEIDYEVEKQKPLLDEMGRDMNKINTTMGKANDKIKNLIKSQSYCKLYSIILAEVVIMFLLLLL